jgi:hypothetical protein
MFIIYMIIGFFFIKPDNLSDIHLTYVEYESGFFSINIPMIFCIIFWIFWLPYVILKYIWGRVPKEVQKKYKEDQLKKHLKNELKRRK